MRTRTRDGGQLTLKLVRMPLVVVVQQGDHRASGGVDAAAAADSRTGVALVAQQHDSIVDGVRDRLGGIGDDDDLVHRFGLAEH